MKKHFPELVHDVIADKTHIDNRYNQCRNHVLKWCATNRIVISRVQLETCEINLPLHISEATALGLASDPPLPHSLAHGDPSSPTVPTVDLCASSDEEDA